MFHYYMVYLLMTGTIMASAGLCLHVVFRSGHRDELQRLQLQTVNRLERILRDDVAASDVVTLTEDGVLTCRSSVANDEAAVETLWRASERDLHRVVQSGDKTHQQERFRFAVGTVITMEQGNGSEIVIQIATPAMGKRSQQSARRSPTEEDNTDSKVATEPEPVAAEAEGVEAESVADDGLTSIRDRLIHLVVFQKPADSDSAGVPPTQTGDTP